MPLPPPPSPPCRHRHTAAVALLLLCKHPPSRHACTGWIALRRLQFTSRGPALAPANNDHQGRGEHNEVDKSSTMMMDCAAIKARGLKRFSIVALGSQGDSTRPAGCVTARCSAFVFFLRISGGWDLRSCMGVRNGGQDYIKRIATLHPRLYTEKTILV